MMLLTSCRKTTSCVQIYNLVFQNRYHYATWVDVLYNNRDMKMRPVPLTTASVAVVVLSVIALIKGETTTESPTGRKGMIITMTYDTCVIINDKCAKINPVFLQQSPYRLWSLRKPVK